MNAIKKVVRKAGNTISKYSPQILVTVGIGAGAATVVTACKQTLSVEELIKPEVEILESINTVESEEYTEEKKKQDKKKAYTSLAKKLGKHYAVPLALATVSVASVCGCYAVLNRNNKELAALAVSYANALTTYRERVRNKYGEEIEQELYYGQSTVVTDPETGKVTEERDPVTSVPLVFYGSDCTTYVNDADYNYTTLKTIQSMCMDRLHCVGCISVYEVKEALGAHKKYSKAEYISEHAIGWVDGETIDFGLDRDDEAVQAFRDGVVNEVWLKFNAHTNLKLV